jgi:hypothetical protein
MLAVHAVRTRRHDANVTTFCGRRGNKSNAASAGPFTYLSLTGRTHFEAVLGDEPNGPHLTCKRCWDVIDADPDATA